MTPEKKEALEAWLKQVRQLMENPPIKSCWAYIENGKLFFYESDYDGDLSYAEEKDEGVLAVLDFETDFKTPSGAGRRGNPQHTPPQTHLASADKKPVLFLRRQAEIHYAKGDRAVAQVYSDAATAILDGMEFTIPIDSSFHPDSD